MSSPSFRVLLLVVTLGAGCFHVSYQVPHTSYLMTGYLAALSLCTFAGTGRRAFGAALLGGLLVFVPQLWFFVSIFGPFAAVLFGILAFWHGLFGLLGQQVRARWGAGPAAILVPVLWTGIEYFRSESYHLRFSWLNVGFAWPPDAPYGSWMLSVFGVYGIGFACMAVVNAVLTLAPDRRRLPGLVLAAGILAVLGLPDRSGRPVDHRADWDREGPLVTVLQLEFPDDAELRGGLARTIRRRPETEILVLSEYTFLGLPPSWIRDWCREHRRHLIAGGKKPLSGGGFANTAFVVDPEGAVVFEQGKSVPIQFFQDGEPAESQSVWESPWGKIGICICYDLGYSRVVDELIRLGAEALIVPTMDVASWGRHEHLLHARIGPARSREYGVSIVRACSSGISQIVVDGVVRRRAGYRDEGATISAVLGMRRPALPWDRHLAPVTTWVSGAVLAALMIRRRRRE